jgi:hypothetical protein
VDLIKITVTYPPGVITGVSPVFNGNGRAALWTDQKKTAAYSGPNPPASAIEFYVEGTRPSSALWDVALKVDYVSGGTPMSFTSGCITVTPILNPLVVTPHDTPSVVFDNGTDGRTGLDTSAPGDTNHPGAVFNATVTRTNTVGTGYFIQNVVGLDNGAGGAAAGWVFTAASGLPNLNSLLNAGRTFPVLDSVPNPPNPFYPSPPFSTAGSDDNVLKMYADDSPNTDYPAANSDKLQNIDVTYRFTLYVVWQFTDTSIYTLASDNWKVVFQAGMQGDGTWKILVPNGVSADSYVLTNADVPAQGLDITKPVMNKSWSIR